MQTLKPSLRLLGTHEWTVHLLANRLQTLGYPVYFPPGETVSEWLIAWDYPWFPFWQELLCNQSLSRAIAILKRVDCIWLTLAEQQHLSGVLDAQVGILTLAYQVQACLNGWPPHYAFPPEPTCPCVRTCSPQQVLILVGLQQGLPVTELAVYLGSSPMSLYQQLARLRLHFGVTSNSELLIQIESCGKHIISVGHQFEDLANAE